MTSDCEVAFKRIPISSSRRAAVYPLSVASVIARCLFAKKSNRNTFVVIEPYGMGDIISLRPMLEVLAQYSQGCNVLIKPIWEDLLPSHPNLQMRPAILPWTSYSGGQKYGVKSLLQGPVGHLIQEIRREAPGSVGIDPRGDIRNILFLYLAGCRQVITLDHYLGTTAKIPFWVAKTVTSAPGARRWQTTEGLLRAAGITHNSRLSPPFFHSCLPHSSPIRQIRCITTAPWPGRLWPTGRWLELKMRLSSAGYLVSGICGPGQANETALALGGAPVFEAPTVASWIDAFRSTDLLITLDTGPMHLADAMGLPLLALFGPGQQPMWAPSGLYSKTVHHQDAPDFYPCHQVDENIELGEKWMNRITVDEVYSSFEKLIRALS